MMTRTSVASVSRYRAMPPATPASILLSAERRSGRAAGRSVIVVDPVSAVAVFMVQGCRRRVRPSIGISPGSCPDPGPGRHQGQPWLRSGLPGAAGVPPPAGAVLFSVFDRAVLHV